MRTHTGEKQYSFKVSWNLKNTFEFTHERNSIHLKCVDHPFHRIFLMTHMRMHMGEKTYSKGVRASSFSLYSDLITHIKTHTRDKPYYCKVYGSYYSMYIYIGT